MNEKWKAKEPKETINIIDNILLENQIYTDILWYTTTSPTQSCRLNLLNGHGVNGKGTTLDYALASGKAELLERLQTFSLTAMPVKQTRCFKDEILLGNIYQLPYLNCTDYSIKYFPSQLPNSNGLASGNTLDEAIVHALCELIERYAYLQLANQNLSCHQHLDIPNEYLNILTQLDLKAILLDVSIFNIPVVALLVYTQDGLVDIELDCAPSFDLAIERCFTEMLQGVNIVEENTDFLSTVGNDDLANEDFYFALMHIRKICIPQRYINYLLNIQDDNQIFEYKYTNNQEMIKTIIKNTKDAFGNIYIRDYSFLSFPTVRCTIDNSYDELLGNNDLHFLNILSYHNKNLILHNNKHTHRILHDIITRINFLSDRTSEQYYNDIIFNKLCEKSILFNMDFDNFIQLLKENE